MVFAAFSMDIKQYIRLLLLGLPGNRHFLTMKVNTALSAKVSKTDLQIDIHSGYAEWIEACYRVHYYLFWTPYKIQFNPKSNLYQSVAGPRCMKASEKSPFYDYGSVPLLFYRALDFEFCSVIPDSIRKLPDSNRNLLLVGMHHDYI